ncbi:MAG: hypothetical protein H7249_04830 [Chitinophagaceae bacterium]|nr:hypothetical protein [Oligoflexus sp.]
MRTRIIIVTLGIALTTACKSTKQNDPCLANVAKRDTIIPPPPAPKEATALALFCPDKKSMSFMNATFLANVAALQYSHYKVAGPAMEKLGFGSPGDGDKFYTKWLIHRIKLINEKTKSIDDTWADEVGRLAALAAVTKLYEDLA